MNVNVSSSGQGTKTVILQIPKVRLIRICESQENNREPFSGHQVEGGEESRLVGEISKRGLERRRRESFVNIQFGFGKLYITFILLFKNFNHSILHNPSLILNMREIEPAFRGRGGRSQHLLLHQMLKVSKP